MESPKKFILPEDVVLVSKDIANLKEISIENFTNQVFKNVRQLFRF